MSDKKVTVIDLGDNFDEENFVPTLTKMERTMLDIEKSFSRKSRIEESIEIMRNFGIKKSRMELAIERMKQTQYPWIGDIPENWETVRIKNILKTPLMYGANESAELDSTSLPRYIRITDIDENGNLKPNTFRSLTHEQAKHYLLEKGDILLARSGASVGKSYHHDSSLVSCFAGYLIKMQVNQEKMMSEFAYLQTLTGGYKDWIVSSTIQATIQNVSAEKYNSFAIPLPPLKTQQKIVDYLDKKTTAIDTLISSYEKLLVLMAEKRQAIISEAVTKGLDTNAPMQDSGVEWIGEIPVGWEVSKVKFATINLDSKRKPINAEDRGDISGDFDYYGASGVIDQINDYIFDETLMLIGEDGANLVFRNLPLVYIAKGKYWVNNHAHIMKNIPSNNMLYLAHQLELADYTNYITGSAQPKLTQDNLNNVPVVLPPLEVQEQIVQYLDEKTSKIDQITTDTKEQIKLLKEYRQSLISEVVTGKVEV